jgi:hypothetical protein
VVFGGALPPWCEAHAPTLLRPAGGAPGAGGSTIRTASSSEIAGRPRTALDAAAAAWLAVLPTAAIAVAALVLLGPTLGATLLPASGGRFWPTVLPGVHPEPTEQARYLIALSAPVLLAALTLLLVRRPPRWLAGSAAGLARGVEVVAVAVLAGCFVAQRVQAPQAGSSSPYTYFTLASVIAAAALAGGIVVGARSSAVRERWARRTAESRARRVTAALVALAALVVTLLPAINTDSSLAQEIEGVIYHLQFTYDESVAVLDGRSPLGDFATQYAALWPYVLAAGMSVLGPSLTVFTGLMSALTGLTLLALYDVLRRLTRNSIAALLLFLPLLATCAVTLHGAAVNRFSLVNYFGAMPLRYAGPFLLAWLTARHLDGARPKRTWPLFLAGGLVVLNNTDFGIAALGATVAALLWTQARTDARTAHRGILEAGAGLAAALGLVSALLLARTGSPPHLSLLLRYARIFVVDGFSMLPIKPLIGLSTVIFLTYVAAIGLATVRAIRRDPDRLLTGMLAWSGIFGLGAGSYYVGHSLSDVLTYSFPPWGLTVTLLALLSIRRLAAAARWPTPAELACLFGFGLLACSLAQTSPPWLQAQRLATKGPKVFAQPVGEAFVARSTRPGEHVLIMSALGHRIAVNLRLDDVERFTGARSVLTVEQLEESLAALRAAGGRKVFVLLVEAFPGMTDVLERDYAPQGTSDGMELWVAR